MNHLSKIFDSVKIKKNCQKTFFLGGIECGPGINSQIHSNPLMGIVSLEHDQNCTEIQIPPEYQQFLDITFSFIHSSHCDLS